MAATAPPRPLRPLPSLTQSPRTPGRSISPEPAYSGQIDFQSEAEGNALDVGRKTRAIPPAMRRALESRDGGCRFPGCTCTRFTDAHHIEHWADGGETKLTNLVLLCRHHHRLLHEGGFSIALRGKELWFVRPDGREIPEVPAAVSVEGDPVEALERDHRAAGVAIDARTGVPGWMGEAADYNYMLAMLDQRAGRR